jgi:hypothetical protein
MALSDERPSLHGFSSAPLVVLRPKPHWCRAWSPIWVSFQRFLHQICLEQSAHGRMAGRPRLAVADAGTRGVTGHQSVITDGNKHAELQRSPVTVDLGGVMACVVPLKRTPTLPPPIQTGTHPCGCQRGCWDGVETT